MSSFLFSLRVCLHAVDYTCKKSKKSVLRVGGMYKYLLILLCFLSVSVFAETVTVSGATKRNNYGYCVGVSSSFTLPGRSQVLSITCDSEANVISCSGGLSNYLDGTFINNGFDCNFSVETDAEASFTVTVTYVTCPDTSKCNKQFCKTCGEWYCSVHETHTGCSADDHADGDHPYKGCPKGCGVCMTCTPEHVGPCECGQMVYGCEKDHECPADCGHDNPCPKCGKVCMTCNPSHVGPCEDCQQPVYGCETNHKCHEGEFGHPLQKCPNCDVCTTCDPSHGSTCEHCDQYFYGCENHNPVQEECSVCHAVYWSCVGHDVANLCPTCHGSNFCGVNGCKVCMDCRPDHIHEDSNVCPVCHGTNFCSKCGKCTNCYPNHCNNEGNSCNHDNLCGTCGKVCMTCNPNHKCGDGGDGGDGGGDCGHNNPCGVNGCTVCKTCKPDHIHVNKPPSGCGHNNLCPKCGKVCMTCNPKHNCGGSGGGTGDDPEEEKEYPDLEIPESPEFVLPSSEALTLLLEKLSPPSFTRGGSGSSGSDVTVIGGINYPKFTIPLDLSGAPFHCGDYSFEVDCVKFSESPLSLLPRITKAASVVLFAYIFIMAVIRSLRQW